MEHSEFYDRDTLDLDSFGLESRIDTVIGEIARRGCALVFSDAPQCTALRPVAHVRREKLR